MFEEITPADLVKVLDYNGYKDKKDYCLSFTEEKISYSSKNKQDYLWTIRFDAGLKVWLPLLETVTGKLKPLPKFDFKKYMIDNGFNPSPFNRLSRTNFTIQEWDDGNWNYFNGLNDISVKPTKENAGTLIAMANLAKELK